MTNINDLVRQRQQQEAESRDRLIQERTKALREKQQQEEAELGY
jgi:hypothetical protein